MRDGRDAIVDFVSGVDEDDAPSPNSVLSPLGLEDEISGGPLRPRDSMGALRPSQARIDEALAQGYAQGLEEAQTDALDDARTILVAILETRFSTVDDATLDRIAEADLETVHRLMVKAVEVSDIGQLFSK